MKNHFKGKPYDYRIIIEVIAAYNYYLSLSCHDCDKIMRKSSIDVDHTPICH